MKIFTGLALGAICAAAIACGAAPQKSVASAAAPPAMSEPLSRQAEIERLDRAIEQQLAELGLPTSQPAACAVGGCAGPTAEMMSSGVQPPSADATCKPAQSEVCRTSCNFSESICDNAKRICEIANELGGNDAFANEKCARGGESCQKSREKCCSCL
ncbi:MAG: hypothetical protein SFX73_05160 [Kofleriaceae bacterium]|nr:hypothetical protein [Kofleriaceae bacterium]